MSNIVKIQTRALGELRVADTELRAGNLVLVRKMVPLKHRTDFSFLKGSGTLMLSPEGADNCNQIANLSVFSPDMADQRRSDVRDGDGLITEVTRRVIVAGRTPLGVMQAIDYSVTLNLVAYYRKNLMGKIKYNHDIGQVGQQDSRPAGDIPWAFIPIVPPLGIWIDQSHPTVFDVMDKFTQDQGYANRLCVSIAKRNALCMHSCMPGKTVGKLERGAPVPNMLEVPVMGFRPCDDYDERSVAGIAQAIAEGQEVPLLETAEVVTAVGLAETEEAEFVREDEGGDGGEDEQESDSEDPGADALGKGGFGSIFGGGGQ